MSLSKLLTSNSTNYDDQNLLLQDFISFYNDNGKEIVKLKQTNTSVIKNALSNIKFDL